MKRVVFYIMMNKTNKRNKLELEFTTHVCKNIKDHDRHDGHSERNPVLDGSMGGVRRCDRHTKCMIVPPLACPQNFHHALDEHLSYHHPSIPIRTLNPLKTESVGVRTHSLVISDNHQGYGSHPETRHPLHMRSLSSSPKEEVHLPGHVLPASHSISVGETSSTVKFTIAGVIPRKRCVTGSSFRFLIELSEPSRVIIRTKYSYPPRCFLCMSQPFGPSDSSSTVEERCRFQLRSHLNFSASGLVLALLDKMSKLTHRNCCSIDEKRLPADRIGSLPRLEYS